MRRRCGHLVIGSSGSRICVFVFGAWLAERSVMAAAAAGAGVDRNKPQYDCCVSASLFYFPFHFSCLSLSSHAVSPLMQPSICTHHKLSLLGYSLNFACAHGSSFMPFEPNGFAQSVVVLRSE